MKGPRSIWLNSYTGKGKDGINKDLIIFAFFLFLSFTFWFLNSLGKVIETDIRYPVRYANIPRERVLVEDLPARRLTLFLKGPGYSILKLKMSGNRTPVILDISDINYRRVPGSSTLSYYIITSGLIPKLTSQLRAECQITSIKPDSLFFTFDRIISKTLPVVPDLEVVTEKQHFIKGKISVVPDSVIVTGPQLIVDTISAVRTKKKRLSGINETLKRNFTLAEDAGYSISEKKVSVTIPVEQFTEAGISVPVRILNLPDSIDIKIFPDAVNVTCLVAVSDYKKISDMPFEAILDIAKADLTSSEKLPVEIIKVPPFVTSLRFTPAKVDFLIEKKDR